MWKQVKGYSSYEVSDSGKVRRKGKRKLKLSPNNLGYVYVDLRANGRTSSKAVHRLVAEHFLTPVKGKTEVHHKDENKQNNSLSNLQWVTHAENLALSGIHKKGQENGSAKLTDEQVKRIKINLRDYNFIGQQTLLANYYKVSPTVIHNIKKEKSWKHIKV